MEALIAQYDRKGRIVCPQCGDSGEIPVDRWLTTGLVPCDNGHQLAITDDVAHAVNTILSKTREGAWRKENLKRFEGTPKDIKPPESGGKIVLP